MGSTLSSNVQSSKRRNSTAEGRSSSHNVLLHETEKALLSRTLRRPNNLTKTTNEPVKKESGENLGVVSQTEVKSKLQIPEN